MDFTDLGEEDDIDVLERGPGVPKLRATSLPTHLSRVCRFPPPPPLLDSVPPPPVPGSWPAPLQVSRSSGLRVAPGTGVSQHSPRKTIRLLDEVRPFEWPCKNNGAAEGLWSKLEPIKVDTSKLEHLFESKSKELSVSRYRLHPACLFTCWVIDVGVERRILCYI